MRSCERDIFTAIIFKVFVSVYIAAVNGAPGTTNRTVRQICGKYDFECDNHSCIDSWLACDGSRDCIDGSDETFKTCSNFKACPKTAFRCNYGACIESSLVCDGVFDCPDGSDESSCSNSGPVAPLSFSQTTPSPCKPGRWSCASGQCINNFLLCDGESNCADGSDETPELCLKIECPSSSFKCSYGACVEGTFKCDGIANCDDRSDENNDDCSEDISAQLSVVTYATLPTTTQRTKPTTLATRPTTGITTLRTIRPITHITSSPAQFTTNRPTTYATEIPIIENTFRPDKPDDWEVVTANPDSDNLPVTPSKITQLLPKKNGTMASIDCLIPEQAEGSYHKVLSCRYSSWTQACLGQPGTAAPFGTVLNYTCHTNYRRADGVTTTSVSVCIDGNWLPTPEPCYRMCRGLASASVDLECWFNGAPVACGAWAAHGTRARRQCKPHYTPVDPGAPWAECNHGDWTEPLFRCRPLCGIRPNLTNVQALISKGKPVSAVEYPWHAAIYTFEPGSETLEYICGGSIIAQYAILTAAHCVFDSEGKKDPSSMAVAVGKTTRSWDSTDPGQMKLLVKDIYLKNDYRGREGNYQFDIAILSVETMAFSSTVLPVCLDGSKALPPTGSLGTVLGFGLTQAASDSSISNILRAAELPLIDKETCRAQSPPDFRNFIGFDKICAGHIQGMGVQRGDSGGGYAFKSPSNNLYYVRGIVSIRQKALSDDDYGEFSVFTNVAEYADYVSNVIACIERLREGVATQCDV